MADNSVMSISLGIRSSKVSPTYLHANSTSHTWPFSAIAELIDNSYDPDVNASEVWIDRRKMGETTCFTFVDNGNGMDQEKLHKMLSFGYCEKVAVGSHLPIGHYGNGFKSGSMRLAKDAIVLTCHSETMSVGFLSQTYLGEINAETVLVPIVTWSQSGSRSVTQETENNLDAIIKHSLFRSEEDILEELNLIKMGTTTTGTKIILYNLKETADHRFELDFESSPFDICNPETTIQDFSSINRTASQHGPDYMKSLREYCSILYLKPKMKIILMTKRVKTKFICKSLSHTEKDVYRPTWLRKPVVITFGFTSSNHNEEHGILFYHKNRLIKAYEKVGYQKQANGMGLGVVGVVEANFLDPIHNKQDFNRTDAYTAFLQAVGQKLNDYWNEKTGGSSQKEVEHKLPDWSWAQCDNCLKWRRLPTGTDHSMLPDKWYCHMNSDAAFNRCDIQEEPEDDDEALLQPSYKKTYKKQQEWKRKQIKVEAENIKTERERMMQVKEQELSRKIQEVEQQRIMVHKSGNVPTNAQLLLANKKIREMSENNARQQQIISSLSKKNREIEKAQTVFKKAGQFAVVLGDSASMATSTPKSTAKRSLNVSHAEDANQSKKICIKTEDGSIVALLPLSDKENEDQSIDVVDLTLEEEEDIKPNVEVLKTQMSIQKNSSNKVSSPAPPNLNTQQPPPSTKEKELLKQKNNEILQLSCKLSATKNKLDGLQQNICKLLKIIVPDVDLGDPEGIGDVVSELIRVNAGQS